MLICMPLPYEMYTKHGIRKYGFHGTSHYFVSNEARTMLEKNTILELLFVI